MLIHNFPDAAFNIYSVQTNSIPLFLHHDIGHEGDDKHRTEQNLKRENGLSSPKEAV